MFEGSNDNEWLSVLSERTSLLYIDKSLLIHKTRAADVTAVLESARRGGRSKFELEVEIVKATNDKFRAQNSYINTR